MQSGQSQRSEDDGHLTVRRVVSGHDERGNAVFTADGELDTSGLVGACLWAYDEAPTFPNDGSPPNDHSYYPPVGGVRFHIATLGSGVNSGATADEIQEFFAAKPHLRLDQAAADEAGYHTDDCITFHIVLAGSVTIELDEGQHRVLRTGDVFVQNGTRHRWIANDDDPATMALFMVGASRAEVEGRQTR